VEELAKILGGGLGHTVDVLGDGRNFLGDPCGGSARGRHEGVAKDAGGAGVDE